MADVNDDLLIPWALDAGTDNIPEYTGRDLRDLFAVFFEPRSESEPFHAAPGILRGMKISATSRQVTVAPGHCIVTTEGGTFLTGVKNPVTLELSAPHATFDRVDLVALSIEETADTGRGAKIEIIEGTPAPSPSAPDTPAGAVTLATVTVSNAGAPRVSPRKKIRLAGEQPDPEVKEFALAGGVRSGQVKATILPGGVAVFSVDVVANGLSDGIAQGIYGYEDWRGLLGDDNNLWSCSTNSRGYLYFSPIGVWPPAGERVKGTFVLRKKG